jgi:hypothetical protein
LREKARANLQLNVRHIFEGRCLQRIAVDPDVGAWASRIIDPWQFFLTVEFEL